MGPCTCNHHYCQPSGSSPCLSQAKKTNQSSRFYCNGIRHDSVGPYGFEAKFQLIWPNEMDVARSYFMALPLFKGSLNIPPFPTCIFPIWKIFGRCPDLRFFTKDLQRETHTHTTLWIFRFASGRCSAVFGVQGASSVC